MASRRVRGWPVQSIHVWEWVHPFVWCFAGTVERRPSGRADSGIHPCVANMVVAKFHPYATDSKERERLPVWFAVSAIAFSYGLHAGVGLLQIVLPWYVELWSPLTFYAV